MNWTEDKPTVDGWYWWRHPLHKDDHIAKISSRRAEFVGDKHIYNLDILKGEWFGPILAPASTPPTYAQGQEEMQSRFEQGYICAVANLLNLFDEPTIAQNVLNELGEPDWSKISEEDKHTLRENGMLRALPIKEGE